MTTKEIKQAHAAIEEYVQKYVFNRGLQREEHDLCKECFACFERRKHKFDKKQKASITKFAKDAARSCLSHGARGSERREDREKIYATRAWNLRGELSNQSHTNSLVYEAMSYLPPDQIEIMLYIIQNQDLEDLAEERGISKSWFYERHIQAAKNAFAMVFGEVVGNPKWYAKLRAEVLAQKKGDLK